MAGTFKRKKRELKTKPFKSESMQLDSVKLHRDIIVKLHELKKPQAYVVERLNIARSTLWRLNQGNEITLTTFFKLVGWLDEDLNKYVTKQKLK